MTTVNFSTPQVESAIGALFSGEHALDAFFSFLRKHPVPLPLGYVAEIVELDANGDDWDDTSYVVFKVKNWTGEKFFRYTTTTSSFGDTYHSILEEVQPVEVKRVSWERV